MEAQEPKDPWLQIAEQAYTESTSYIDTNYRKKWENALAHFNNEHTSDSKYNTARYRYRSKMFRPKTRASIRNVEAAAVSAFFANEDVINCEGQNQNDPKQAASAKLMDEVLNYRLTESIPWFQICIGGVQDAQVIGVVASYQFWDYEEEVETVTEVEQDQWGNEIEVEKEQPKILKDEPLVELLAIENIRIHPAADWLDPIGTSPYVQRMVPLFAQDVLERMEAENPKTGEPKWKKYTLDEIMHSQKYLFDSTRLDRDGTDKYGAGSDHETQGSTGALKTFDIVWCIENFVRKKGKEWVYWTLGTAQMLSEPKELEEVYWHGERPIVMGCCLIETNRLFPSGTATLGAPLQKELNENANQRADNVKLVMNKRYIGRRGADIDFDSLLRNVAGSVTLADDPMGDVREMEFNDVTASAYQEQDRLSLDFDELVGTFSQSSVQSNRKLNETVGGMAMLQGGANAITEFTLRTIAETWVEPVLRQLVLLEQMYETDQVVLALAADRAKLWQKFGIDDVTDELLGNHLTVKVNVGMGATDPTMRLNSFMAGITSFANVLQNVPEGVLNVDEVGKEIFGRMGYSDGGRFLQNQDEQQDPEKMQLQQALQQAQQIIQQLQQAVQDREADRQAKLQIAEGQSQTKLMDTQIKEAGDDRRTEAEIAASLIEKRMDVTSRGNS